MAGKITKLRTCASFRESTGDHTARIWRNGDGQLVGGPYTWRFGDTQGWLELDIPGLPVAADTEYAVSITTAIPEGAWGSRVFHGCS